MRILQLVWPTVLGVTLAPFAAWAGVRLLGVERGYPMMQLMAYTPYVAAAAPVPLLAALATRQWWHAVAAGVLVVVLAACVLPRAVPWSWPGRASAGTSAGTPAGAPRLRVLTANLFIGAADARAVVTLVRGRQVDLLAVQELTPAEASALDAAGLARLLPYRTVHAVPGSGAGSALYSRLPLTDPGVRRLPSGHAQAYATLTVPGARPVVVESAHPCAPSNDVRARQWAAEIALQPAATPAGAVRLLLGDLNSTLDHDGLRRLIGTGYRDAAQVTGAGLRPTWPFDARTYLGGRLPPVTLDHVLADRRIGVLDLSVYPVSGSDHRAVYADLVLPFIHLKAAVHESDDVQVKPPPTPDLSV